MKPEAGRGVPVFSLAMALLLWIAALVPAEALSADEPKTGDALQVQVEQLVKEVKRALYTVAHGVEENRMLNMKSVTLTLETELVAAGEGRLNLVVVALGSKASKASTQTITVKMTPPATGTRGKDEPSKISKNLSNAILSVARGVHRAGEEKPHLKLTELTARIRFAVAKSADAKAGFTILPATAELGGELAETNTHTVEIVFQSPE